MNTYIFVNIVCLIMGKWPSYQSKVQMIYRFELCVSLSCVRSKINDERPAYVNVFVRERSKSIDFLGINALVYI